MSEIERRFIDADEAGIEVRAADDEAAGTVTGYAAVFDSLSEPMGGFRERIAPGAFDDVLADDVRALFNHDPNHILGRTRSGTLRLFTDERGLGYEITPPDTQGARDLMTSIKRGDVSQSSFAFRVDEENWDEDEDGLIIRTIAKVRRLYDVSPVTYPAYPDATVATRSLEQWRAEREADDETSAPDYDLFERELKITESL